MPSKLRLRPMFAPIVKFIAKFLSKIGVTPNIATILMLVCSGLSVYFLFVNDLLWFGLFLFITGIMDGVDGAIARLTKQTSSFGGFFDSTSDRLSEGIIFAGLIATRQTIFFLSQNLSLLVIFIALISSFLFSYMRARIEIIDKGYDTNVGVMARSERLFFLFIISLLAHFVEISLFTWGFIIFTIAVCLSTIHRFLSYKRQIDATE